MGLKIGTIVTPIESDFSRTSCLHGKCVGKITEFDEPRENTETNPFVYASVTWWERCFRHTNEKMPIMRGWYTIDQLWEIGQIN